MSVPTSMQKTGPTWRNLSIILGIILIFLFSVEGVLRLLVISKLLPIPGIGSIHPELNVKLPKLDEFVKENGRVDCIFVGSSMIDDSVNPQVFTKEYERLSGKKIHCFNLSIASLTAETAYSLTMAISNKYHPNLILYGVSPRDLTSDFDAQTRPIVKEPWVRFHAGEFSVSGWLKEYSYAFREYLSFVFTLNPDNRKSIKNAVESVQMDGFSIIDKNIIALEGQNFIKKWEPNPNDMRGLKKLLRLSLSNTPEVVIFEAPIHQLFLEKYIEGSVQKYFLLFQKPISELTNNFDADMIISVQDSSSFIPDEDWGDVKHLNYKGAEIFSRWLANQLWNQIESSTIPDPF